MSALTPTKVCKDAYTHARTRLSGDETTRGYRDEQQGVMGKERVQPPSTHLLTPPTSASPPYHAVPCSAMQCGIAGVLWPCWALQCHLAWSAAACTCSRRRELATMTSTMVGRRYLRGHAVVGRSIGLTVFGTVFCRAVVDWYGARVLETGMVGGH